MKKIILALTAALAALAFWRRHEVKSAAERGAKAAKPAAAAMKDRISGSSSQSEDDVTDDAVDEESPDKSATADESEQSTSD